MKFGRDWCPRAEVRLVLPCLLSLPYQQDRIGAVSVLITISPRGLIDFVVDSKTIPDLGDLFVTHHSAILPAP